MRIAALCFLSCASMSIVSHPAFAQVGDRALGRHDDQELECDSKSNKVDGVATPIGFQRRPTVDFSQSQGGLDPVPLLETAIRVEKHRKSCVIAHFSALVVPADNHAMFQVSVDGVAMAGHTRFPFITPSPATPVVWESHLSPLENSTQMVAYNFFAEVHPGDHVVEVRFANCCSANPPAAGTGSLVLSVVLTLEYNE
jgi:hypothetical protein